MSLSSNSNGTANFTDLDIAYDIEFAVTTSAGTIGSLSNSLNQQMLPGSGTFTVTLPVETTKPGQFDATYLSMNYTLGAPNLALPPTPLLSVQSLTESSVTIEWQALSEFGTDLQEFQVFRMSPTAGYDYTSPYEIVVGQNTFSDSNVDVGSTYGYIVRSIHSFGIVSNLSQALEVTIPNPPAPAAVTNVQLFDLDMETASNPLKVTWDASTDSNVVEYRVYVAESDLDAAGLNNELTPAKGYIIDGVTYQAVATVPSQSPRPRFPPPVNTLMHPEQPRPWQFKTVSSTGSPSQQLMATITQRCHSPLLDQRPRSTTPTSTANWNFPYPRGQWE